MNQGLHVRNPWVSWATLLVPEISVLGSPAQIDPQLLPCRFKKRWGFPAAFQMGRWENVPRGSVPSLVLCPALIIPAPILFKDGLDPAILQGKIPRGPPTLARPEGCVVGELGFSSLICCRMLGYPCSAVTSSSLSLPSWA